MSGKCFREFGNRCFSAAMVPYVEALLRSDRWFHPEWSAQQIKGAATRLVPGPAEAIKAGQRRGMERLLNGEGFIYLAEVIGHYPIVKVGHALDANKRMQTLATDTYGKFQFRLLKATPGHFEDERYIHRRLFRRRWRGTHHREYYEARTIYESGVDLPQGFMVALRAFMDREVREAA